MAKVDRTLASRRVFLQRCTLAAAAAVIPVAQLDAAPAPRSLDSSGTRDRSHLIRESTWLNPESLQFLEQMTRETLEKARVRPGEIKPGGGVNTTGITLITPGGNYPAFWIRDYAMALESGLAGPDEMLPQLRLIARSQNGETERRLGSGAIIPPFAIPDHIRMDGGAVFYPGTYSAGEDQGADPWGPLPPADDHFYFIQVAYHLWKATKSVTFLSEDIGGRSMLDRLCAAFRSPETDVATGAVISTRERRAVGFGFQDTIYLLGSMCFATLLRWQAARRLEEMAREAAKQTLAAEMDAEARRIQDHVQPTFMDPQAVGGWLRAATVVGRQPDIWATLFALHLGILSPPADRRARETVADAIRRGQQDPVIEYRGAVRHVPVGFDYSAQSAWERCAAGGGTYQNGAYWHTPTGWLIEALSPIDPDLAQAVFDRYIANLRSEDFRKGGGAPWECFGIGGRGAQNPVYLASVALPLGSLRGENSAQA